MNNTIFLNIAKIDFQCPHCKAKHDDADERYLKRCNENKSGITKINCKCGKSFGMTYDYQGNAVSFIIKTKIDE